MNQPGADQRGEASEQGLRHAVSQGEPGRSDLERHDLGDEHNQRAIISGIDQRQPQFDRQEMAEAATKKDREATRRLRQRVAETYSQEHCTALFQEMKKLNAWIDPTFVSGWLRWRIATGEAQKDPNVRFVPEYLRTEWADPSNSEGPPTPAQQEQERKDEEARKKMVLAMKTAEVGILTGSDTGDPYVLPGFVVHQEMALLVEYGLSPAEALRASTLEPARYFGTTASEGTVERGKNANLVIVAANPLADISNTRRVDAVVLRGKLLKRDQLDALLKDPK